METAIAWNESIVSKATPHTLILSRQNLPFVQRTEEQINSINKGGYLLSKHNDASLTLIASGSELQLILLAAEELETQGIKANVVSMPCLDKFYTQSDSYRSEIIPPAMIANDAISYYNLFIIVVVLVVIVVVVIDTRHHCRGHRPF